MAVRALLPEVRTIVTRLIYLADDPATFELRGEELDRAIADATALSGGGSGDPAKRPHRTTLGAGYDYDDMRLALPADRESYLRRKAGPSRVANRELTSFGMLLMTLVDRDNRRRAMTDFTSVLLVEAAAGTGKTL